MASQLDSVILWSDAVEQFTEMILPMVQQQHERDGRDGRRHGGRGRRISRTPVTLGATTLEGRKGRVVCRKVCGPPFCLSELIHRYRSP